MGIKLVFYRKESVIVGDWEGNILAFKEFTALATFPGLTP